MYIVVRSACSVHRLCSDRLSVGLEQSQRVWGNQLVEVFSVSLQSSKRSRKQSFGLASERPTTACLRKPPNPHTFPVTMASHYFAALIQFKGGAVFRKNIDPPYPPDLTLGKLNIPHTILGWWPSSHGVYTRLTSQGLAALQQFASGGPDTITLAQLPCSNAARGLCVHCTRAAATLW